MNFITTIKTNFATSAKRIYFHQAGKKLVYLEERKGQERKKTQYKEGKGNERGREERRRRRNKDGKKQERKKNKGWKEDGMTKRRQELKIYRGKEGIKEGENNRKSMSVSMYALFVYYFVIQGSF